MSSGSFKNNVANKEHTTTKQELQMLIFFSTNNTHTHTHTHTHTLVAQSVGAVEYSNCFSAEG